MTIQAAARRGSGRRRSLRKEGGLIERLEARTLLSANSVIDIMVLYTPQALSAAGSFAALDYRIQRAIADTNGAMANSRVSATLRLVHEGEVGYNDSGQLNTDLSNLQQGAGGMAGVQALRDHYGADLVSLWVGSGGGPEAGLAFQANSTTNPLPDYGYNVIEEPYADDNFVFAHEIGHNLGAGHDTSDPSARSIPYAYGKTLMLGNYAVGDIMNETAAERIPYYSNPNVSFQGVPTGNPDDSAHPADNARAMNELAPLVAGYEPTRVPDMNPPTAALLSAVTNPWNQTLTIQVEYQDDTAVSVASLGTGDVLITGPNGFSHLGTLEGVDMSPEGSQRVATYQVSIAGSTSDPAAYAFTLQPGRVQDVYGNVAASAPLGAPSAQFPNRAGPRLCTALDTGVLDGTNQQFATSINPDQPTAFYRFTLASSASFTAKLQGMTASVGELVVQDKNSDGIIQSSEQLSAYQPGTSPQTISLTLAAGTYDLWVAPAVSGTSTPYTLTMSAASVPPITGTPPPAPTFNISGASTVNEQAVYTLSLSSNDAGHAVKSWTINWGDGNTQTIDGNPNSAAHTYVAGPHGYTITASATDDTGAAYPAAKAQAVSVLHAPPLASISGAASVPEFAPYTLNLSATDPGHTVQGWSIDWGDGSAVQAVTGSPTEVTHTYGLTGGHLIQATLTDDVGSYVANTLTVTATPVPPAPVPAPPVDQTPPTAAVSASDVTSEGSSYTFSVTYSDNVAIDAATIRDRGVVVTGPGGFSQPAALLGVSGGSASAITATYSISAPASGWTHADRGAYTIALLPNQVADTSGNLVPAGALGSFNVDIPLPSAGVLELPVRGSRHLRGVLAGPSDSQFYTLSVPQDQIVTIQVTLQRPGLTVTLLDANQNPITTKTGRRGATIKLTLTAGTYYLELATTSTKAARFTVTTTSRPVPVPKHKPVKHASRSLFAAIERRG